MLNIALKILPFFIIAYISFLAGEYFQSNIVESAKNNPQILQLNQSPAPNSDQITDKEPEFEAASLNNWNTFTAPEGLSIQYPPEWIIKSFNSGKSPMHWKTVELQGKEGRIRLTWGEGLGGACTTEYKEIQIKNKTISLCYSLNDNGSEVWSSAGFTAAAYSPAATNRDLILKILTTLEFY